MRNVAVAARAAGISASLLCVGDALHQQHPNVLVGKPIDRALPLAPECDEVPISKQPQLVADGRLRHTSHGRKIADAEILDDEGLEDAKPSRVSQRGEDVGRTLHDSFVWQLIGYPLDGRRVDDEGFALVGRRARRCGHRQFM
jgi:hypothetical protein